MKVKGKVFRLFLIAREEKEEDRPSKEDHDKKPNETCEVHHLL